MIAARVDTANYVVDELTVMNTGYEKEKSIDESSIIGTFQDKLLRKILLASFDKATSIGEFKMLYLSCCLIQER